MSVLQSAFWSSNRRKRRLKELAGDIKASWGGSDAVYVLHLSDGQDLRTGYETSNTQNVFDGTSVGSLMRVSGGEHQREDPVMLRNFNTVYMLRKAGMEQPWH